MEEQRLETTTEVHLDFIDRMKVLFGRTIKVNVVILIPTKIEMYSAVSTVEIAGKTEHKFYKDLPDYGYTDSGN